MMFVLSLPAVNDLSSDPKIAPSCCTLFPFPQERGLSRVLLKAKLILAHKELMNYKEQPGPLQPDGFLEASETVYQVPVADKLCPMELGGRVLCWYLYGVPRRAILSEVYIQRVAGPRVL